MGVQWFRSGVCKLLGSVRLCRTGVLRESALSPNSETGPHLLNTLTQPCKNFPYCLQVKTPTVLFSSGDKVSGLSLNTK